MNNENLDHDEAAANSESKLHTVTPLSKYLAMILFVVLPFLGGWIGYTYAPEKIVVKEVPINSSDVSQPQLNGNKVEIITNDEYGFSFNKPTGWQLKVIPTSNGWEEYVLTPTEQSDTSGHIIVSISPNYFEGAATVPASLFDLEIPPNWPPSSQRLICEPSDDEIPVGFERTEENLREFCKANTRSVTIFTDITVGDNFVWSINAKYEAENDQMFEEAIARLISSFQRQADVNENEPEDIRMTILDIAEIVATMTVTDFEVLVDTSNPDFLNKTFGRNNNLIHSAIANKDNPQMVQKLIDVGVDMNHQDADIRTPLHHAIDANNQQAAQILIENGADVTLENEAGFSSLQFCEEVLKSLPNHETCTYMAENVEI